MKMTQQQRDALRQVIQDAEDDAVIVIGDHETWRRFRGHQASIVAELLDDADRADELQQAIRKLPVFEFDPDGFVTPALQLRGDPPDFVPADFENGEYVKVDDLLELMKDDDA